MAHKTNTARSAPGNERQCLTNARELRGVVLRNAVNDEVMLYLFQSDSCFVGKERKTKRNVRQPMQPYNVFFSGFASRDTAGIRPTQTSPAPSIQSTSHFANPLLFKLILQQSSPTQPATAPASLSLAQLTSSEPPGIPPMRKTVQSKFCASSSNTFPTPMIFRHAECATRYTNQTSRLRIQEKWSLG